MEEILVCVDDPLTAPAVCDYAAWVSLRLGAETTLLQIPGHSTVLPRLVARNGREVGFPSEHGTPSSDNKRLLLETCREHLLSRCIGTPRLRRLRDPWFDHFTRLHEEADLIVMGNSDAGSFKARRTSRNGLAQKVGAMSRPVLIVSEPFQPPQRVMVAYDGSETIREMVRMIAQSPLFAGIRIHLVTVNKSLELLHEPEKMLVEAGRGVSLAVRMGHVDKALEQYQKANKIDMVMLGKCGQSVSGSERIGSAARAVLSSMRVPVFLAGASNR